MPDEIAQATGSLSSAPHEAAKDDSPTVYRFVRQTCRRDSIRVATDRTEATQMNYDKLIAAVGAIEQRGWSPAPLEMIADEAHWRGPELEQTLNLLASLGRLDRHKLPDCDPAYASRRN
jgi:hypothetical protein